MSLEIGVWTIWISRKFEGQFFRREEHVFKEDFWAWPLI